MNDELKRNWKEILKDYVVKVKDFTGKTWQVFGDVCDSLDKNLEKIRKSWLFIAMTLAFIVAVIGML